MRRLRVMMLNANCIGSWWAYWPRFSNHSRLACAARCVDSTTGLRSASYAASAASRSSCSCRQAASANASSIASLVPDPIEKWAVWAASPRRTTLPWRHDSFRTVVKLIHRELLASTSWPSRASANSSRMRSIDLSSDSPGTNARSANASNSAARHTDSCISTMTVLPVASYG